jgi:hypothetical protein
MGDETQDPSETDWEGEGGASQPAPTQRTPKGLEIPVPKRKDLMDAFRKIAKGKKKP